MLSENAWTRTVLTTKCDQVARAYFLQHSEPGGSLNGAGRQRISEEAGWQLAVDRGGRITPKKQIVSKEKQDPATEAASTSRKGELRQRKIMRT